MANSYHHMTGVLKLKKVTPVIKALFTCYELDEDYPGDGECYIGYMSESQHQSWEEIAEELASLSTKLGLPALKEEPSLVELLTQLAGHYGKTRDGQFETFAGLDECDDPELSDLFELAQALDDGHGLRSIAVERAWTCSRPRLYEFGGAGEFVSRSVNTWRDSGRIVAAASELDEALQEENLERALNRVLLDVDQVLDGIRDPEKRKVIRNRLSEVLGKTIEEGDAS